MSWNVGDPIIIQNTLVGYFLAFEDKQKNLSRIMGLSSDIYVLPSNTLPNREERSTMNTREYKAGDKAVIVSRDENTDKVLAKFYPIGSVIEIAEDKINDKYIFYHNNTRWAIAAKDILPHFQPGDRIRFLKGCRSWPASTPFNEHDIFTLTTTISDPRYPNHWYFSHDIHSTNIRDYGFRPDQNAGEEFFFASDKSFHWDRDSAPSGQHKCTCPPVNFYWNGIGCKCGGI